MTIRVLLFLFILLPLFGCKEKYSISKYSSPEYIVNEKEYLFFDNIYSDVNKILNNREYRLDTDVEEYYGKPISIRSEKQSIRWGFIIGGDVYTDGNEYNEYSFGTFEYWTDSVTNEKYLTKFHPSEKEVNKLNIYYGKTNKNEIFQKYGREMYSPEHGGIIYMMRGFNFIFYFNGNELLQRVEVSFI